ncbi:MAG: fluoride efflux transporter CrcB [Pseudomonadota bacterium]
MSLLQIALGGALGAVLRHLTVMGARAVWGVGFPWGTLIVNVLGSFLMGILAVVLIERGLLRDGAPFLMVGVLGAYTTFSAFSLDVLLLWERGLAVRAVGYAAVSVLLSVAALILGLVLARQVTGP